MKLFVVGFHGSGGIAHYTYQLCTALARQEGVEVTLITTTDYELAHLPHNYTVERRLELWPHFTSSMSQAGRNPLRRLQRKLFWTLRRGGRALRLLRTWHDLTSYLISQRPDIIQFSHIQFPFEGFFLARLRRHGLALTQICHEFDLREQSSLTLRLLARRFYASAYTNFSAIFFLGEPNRRAFLSLFATPAERTHTIPHGNESMFLEMAYKAGGTSDLRQRYGIAPDEPVVLFFGTLTPSKGLPELFRAFAQVRQHCRARLVVAGFPLKHVNIHDFYALVEQLGITDAVVFDKRYIPFEEVGALMELAEVVVYPYRNATQSGSLQVAYTFGRPVIATRVGGLPEVVENGRSGFLIAPGSVEELAAAMRTIITDPERTAEMGRYAKHLSETRFSWQPIARRVIDIYHEVRTDTDEATAAAEAEVVER
jgi:glycosyltransferase involved in cell wall biosynthesis